MWSEQLLSMESFVARLGDDPPGDWLSPAETDRLAELRAPARRLEWLSGRWLAKELLQRLVTGLPASRRSIHIESLDGRGRAVRPQVYVGGRLQPWRVSIAHSARFVYVAAARHATWRVGADVTPEWAVSHGFLNYWLTPAERDWSRRRNETSAACLVWSLKESWFKATGGDQRFAPRRWDVSGLAAKLGPLPPPAGRAGYVSPDPCWWEDDQTLVGCRRVPGEIATVVVQRDGTLPGTWPSRSVLCFRQEESRT
jgi:phosphopantetheinyl transferase